ncbi:endonuclease/exonuclease/phosphatase family protein [Paenibacillus sp. MER TA 81-3]|uniref:endonuclease/exonuclease/phosphatase family protein n=1 Tax=Paenibacillus sp. MER TA 81-3 TaxID=2939573 RepID=UPI00203B4510|nr:endonuclease/exonuclease/phosphatase family protein [Paenibacillus sp. MER TA 81-3]MCM3339813.1 endonuclease/exonuclease/phosphatase family protein [Paenibacillus sp. MER TA 81-3]
MQLNILTFNIHHGRGTDGKLDLSRIAHIIEASGADVIGLNELDRSFLRRSALVDQLQWLAERLNMHAAFGATVTLPTLKRTPRQYGNGLLSRFPIISHSNHPLNVLPIKLEGRAMLEACLLAHGQPFKLFVTHLSINPVLKAIQANRIRNKLINESMPHLVMGDFNLRPGTATWLKMNDCVRDVCHAAHSSPVHTFPSYRPLFQFDYIFASSHFQIDSVEALRLLPSASDHLPLKVSLTLANNPISGQH